MSRCRVSRMLAPLPISLSPIQNASKASDLEGTSSRRRYHSLTIWQQPAITHRKIDDVRRNVLVVEVHVAAAPGCGRNFENSVRLILAAFSRLATASQQWCLRTHNSAANLTIFGKAPLIA
jgi:hypothetical protein